MVDIKWDEEKNKLLKKTRGVSFDDVILALQDDRFIAIEEHPNKNRYPHQKILILNLNNYIHIVPFVESENEIFLKTIYPDRKYHKKYHKESKWEKNQNT